MSVEIKPKLLLIAGYFPPVRISSGSIRPWNLARCLIELGWEVIVVTPKISIWNENNLDDVENVEQNIKNIGIKMIYTEHHLVSLAPWRYNQRNGTINWVVGGGLRRFTRFLGIQNWVGWVPAAIAACSTLNSNDVDIILATGAPFWGYEIAYRLSRRLRKPFVMDYRDLWTDNPWNIVGHKWVINHEKKLLQKCAAITIVSQISGIVLGEKYGVQKKIITITNGYDGSEVNNVQPYKFDHFSIIFAGSLISPKLTLETLCRALALVKQKCPEKHSWKFHYYGPNVDEVSHEVVKWDIVKESVIHGNVPRKEVLGYEKGASLNVVVSSNSNVATMSDKGVIPGKVFELIGMKAPILPIVPNNSAIENLLSECGVKSFSHNEVDKISSFLIACMDGYQIVIDHHDEYSWEALSKKFDRLLKNIILNIPN